MPTESDAPVERVLVIAVDRLGDVLQAAATLHAVRSRFHGARIDLLALANFAEVLAGSPFHDRFLGLSPEDVQGYDRVAEGLLAGGTVTNEGFAELVDTLRAEQYDLVVNLVTNTLGAWLTTVASPRFLVGLYIAADRSLLVEGSSLRYFVALLDFRDENPFNLVDLFRASVAEPRAVALPEVYIASAPTFLLPSGDDVVALNPGASQADRRWPLSRFAELADSLVADGFRVFLVGSPADQALCEAVRTASHSKPTAYLGLTVPEMAGWFATLGCVVANDTGAMHVAAAAGAKAVGIYGGFARYRETAPFGGGYLVLESEELTGVEVAAVRAAVLATVGRLGEPEARASWGSGLEVARTRIDPDRPGELGGLRFDVLVDRHGDGPDALRNRIVRTLVERTFARRWGSSEAERDELVAALEAFGNSEVRTEAGEGLLRWAEALEAMATRWLAATEGAAPSDEQIAILLKVEAMNVGQILGDGIVVLAKLLEWDLKMICFTDMASFGAARSTVLRDTARLARRWAAALIIEA